MLEQTPLEDEPKPDETPAPSAPDIGTSIKGDGPPDGFGVGANKGAVTTLGGSKGSGAGLYDFYARQVNATIAAALSSNPHTRKAVLRVEVRIWPDVTGRVTRATLAGSTGDPAVDNALRNEVLTGLQLAEPPPEKMPLPIVLLLTARRPN